MKILFSILLISSFSNLSFGSGNFCVENVMTLDLSGLKFDPNFYLNPRNLGFNPERGLKGNLNSPQNSRLQSYWQPQQSRLRGKRRKASNSR